MRRVKKDANESRSERKGTREKRSRQSDTSGMPQFPSAPWGFGGYPMMPGIAPGMTPQMAMMMQMRYRAQTSPGNMRPPPHMMQVRGQFPGPAGAASAAHPVGSAPSFTPPVSQGQENSTSGNRNRVGGRRSNSSSSSDSSSSSSNSSSSSSIGANNVPMIQDGEVGTHVGAERSSPQLPSSEGGDGKGPKDEVYAQAFPTAIPRTPPDWLPHEGNSDVPQEGPKSIDDDGSKHAEEELLADASDEAEKALDDDGEDVLPKPKPPPKPGKISFSMQGAKAAVEAAQAQVQAREAVAAARAKRLTLRDASTQTVRDPERHGDIVTIWRLRPRGMEAFPHFPRRKSKREKLDATEDDGEASRMSRRRIADAEEGVVTTGGTDGAETIDVEFVSLSTNATLTLDTQKGTNASGVVEHSGGSDVAVTKQPASAKSASGGGDGEEELERQALVEALCGLASDDEDGE